MAFVDVESIRKLYVSLTEDDVGTRLQADIRQARQHYQYTQALKLPSLIRKPQDVYSFYLDAERPTFVTQGVVEAPVVLEADLYNRDVTGCIVLIRSADPGYDFLFAKNIAGLVTQYGGANSHMAIRCAELGLPAVIGAGEALFNQWTTWDRLRIDGINQQVLPLYGTSAQPMVSASR
jgi:phosphohistidine swiveling domain-containing protein